MPRWLDCTQIASNGSLLIRFVRLSSLPLHCGTLVYLIRVSISLVRVPGVLRGAVQRTQVFLSVCELLCSGYVVYVVFAARILGMD